MNCRIGHILTVLHRVHFIQTDLESKKTLWNNRYVPVVCKSRRSRLNTGVLSLINNVFVARGPAPVYILSSCTPAPQHTQYRWHDNGLYEPQLR